jgi:hypothetical protein
MKTTMNVPTGWQPDPSGGHELRLFSPEGDPTAHVSDGGRNSYEEMPGAVIIDPPRIRRSLPARPAVGSSPGSWEDQSAEPDGRAPRTQRKKQLAGTRRDVRLDQMARLVARITLLTSVDPQRRVRRVMPACSLILLAALLERN